MKKSFLSALLGRKSVPPAGAGDGAFAEIAGLPFGPSTFGDFVTGVDRADPFEALEGIARGFGHLEQPALSGDLRVRLLLSLDDHARDSVAAAGRGLFVNAAAEVASEPHRQALQAYFERFGAAALATLAPPVSGRST